MIKHLLALSCLAIALPAMGEEDSHLSEKDGVRLVHAWTNATSDDHANVYLEIENTSGKIVTLTGGKSDLAEEVELMGAAIKAGGEGVEIEIPKASSCISMV